MNGYLPEALDCLLHLNTSLEIAEQETPLAGTQVSRLLDDSILKLADRIGTGIWDVIKCE